LKNNFDLIVIGSGSGGLAAAKRACSYGASVAVVEEDKIGGTCVIRGCVPKKLLVYGGLISKSYEEGTSFGFINKVNKFDSKILLNNVRMEVNRLSLLHENSLKEKGITLFRGFGVITDKNIVTVYGKDNSKESINLYAEKILIAVGGQPISIDISGKELLWNSNDMFLLDSLPQKIVIVGGGYIACEFSSILNNLGTKVIHLVRSESILREFDKDISQSLANDMINLGIELRFKEEIIEVKKQNNQLYIKTSNEQSIISDGVLIAIGRKPNLQRLNLERIGINMKNNNLDVDENFQTSLKNVFAIGDIIDGIKLTPVAVEQGRLFADNVFGGKKRKSNFDFIPKAVFSYPEVASVGMTELESRKVFLSKDIKVYCSKFRAMSKSLSKKGPKCLLKIIVNKKTDKILGCHMIGEQSSEIIQMASIAISMGALKSDFDLTMALHPTISEEFVTMY
tara:strand:+ start:1249 stop:2610 length:1362 start_codon:yes stop_codon:yes gene_type:complete